MKKNILAVALALASSLSYGAAFDGPYLQLGVGASRAHTALNGDNYLAYDATSPLDGLSSFGGKTNGLLSMGYSRRFEGLAGFNLAANAFYVIGDQDAGSNSNSKTKSGIAFDRTYSAALTETFGFTLEPGWYLSGSTLAYLKLAWVHSTYDVQNRYLTSITQPLDFSLRTELNGVGYGVGGKQMLGDHMFAAVDLMAVTYENRSVGSSKHPFTLSTVTSQLLGFAGAGYKF